MRTLFNDGWSFAKKHIASGQKLLTPQEFYGKEPDNFSSVHIPHDWMISNTNDLYEDSVGFYKKTFTVEKTEGKRFALRFEGVYMNWCVYINGHHAFEWKYGYTTVEAEITQFVKEGQNQIELIAVYQNPNTRWYSGAGIFRDVYLVTNETVRIADGGIYFVASQKDADSWNVCIRTEIDGQHKELGVSHELTSEDGKKLSFENVRLKGK
jgi:beta-galactosidase